MHAGSEGPRAQIGVEPGDVEPDLERVHAQVDDIEANSVAGASGGPLT